jgi:hypothetical protein
MTSLIGLLASSKGVSEISALGTITSATMKRRQALKSRVSLAWWRNITSVLIIPKKAFCKTKRCRFVFSVFKFDTGRNRSPQGVLRFRAGGNCSSERRLGGSLILRDEEVKRNLVA